MSRGVLTAKHIKNLGPAFPLFLLLVSWKRFGSVYVRGGAPVTIWALQLATGYSERTIQNHLRRMIDHGYIIVRPINLGRRKGAGLVIRISKPKDWVGNVRREIPARVRVQKSAGGQGAGFCTPTPPKVTSGQ